MVLAVAPKCGLSLFQLERQETKIHNQARKLDFFFSSFLPTCLHATLVLSCKFVAPEKVFFTGSQYKTTERNMHISNM